MSESKKRSYNAESRKTKAKETRERIISSARTLFETQGFENSTIEEIAQYAHVSVPTVYALFNSKVGIVKAIMDRAVAPEQYESLVRRAVTEQSPAQRIAMAAVISRQLYDAERAQSVLFQNTSILTEELKNLEIEKEKRRHQRLEKSFKEMVKMGVLAEDLSVSKAHDILWALTGRDVYRMLVIERGWKSDEYEQLLSYMLKKILLK